MRRRALAVILLALALSSIVLGDSISLSLHEDAEADFLAVSVFGNSTSAVAISGTGDARNCGVFSFCVAAVSGTGNATCRNGLQCMAVSATGNASAQRGCFGGPTVFVCGEGMAVAGGASEADFFAVSITESAFARDVAVSGGNAECRRDFCVSIANHDSVACSGAGGNKCLAGSLQGDARACDDGDALRGFDCIAIAPIGEASSCGRNFEGYQCAALSGTGPATSNIAASATGDAKGRQHHILGTDIDLGALAVSGTGNATSCAGSDLCIAVSGTGHAEGATAVSGCDTLAAAGRPEACVAPI